LLKIPNEEKIPEPSLKKD